MNVDEDLKTLGDEIKEILAHFNNTKISEMEYDKLELLCGKISIVVTSIDNFKVKDANNHFRGSAAQKDWFKVEDFNKILDLEIKGRDIAKKKEIEHRHDRHEEEVLEIAKDANVIAKNAKWCSILAIIISVSSIIFLYLSK